MLNPVIETAIGLIFVYLLLSMICSAVQEWIAALFALRAATLEKGIRNMLSGDSNLADQILANPLVAALSRKSMWDSITRREARPSYISAETFARAFVAEANIAPAAPGGRDLTVPTTARNGKGLDANTQKLIQMLAPANPGDLDGLRKNVEGWYNDAMDRVSGWYKRKSQLIIVILGLIVAIIFNADTFMLGRAFWNDPALRANVSAAAAQWVNTHNPPSTFSPVSSNNANNAAAGANPAKPGPAAKPAKPADIADLYPSVTSEEAQGLPPQEQPYSAEQIQRAEQQYRDAEAALNQTSQDVMSQLKALKIPLGWCSTKGTPTTNEEGTAELVVTADENCDPGHQFPPSDAKGLLFKLAGLLVTMLALSQGAPFWFDLLKNITNLRLAGDAPDEKKK